MRTAGQKRKRKGFVVVDSTHRSAAVSESSDIEHDANGLVQHVSEDLPDAEGYTSASEQASARQQLLSESVAPAKPAGIQPERKGKLKRISLPTVGGARPRQRALGKTVVPRLDPYSLIDSPEKPRYPVAGRLAQALQPSPTRKQKRAMKAFKLNNTTPSCFPPSTQPASEIQLNVALNNAVYHSSMQTPPRLPHKGNLDTNEAKVQPRSAEAQDVQYQGGGEVDPSSRNELFYSPKKPSVHQAQKSWQRVSRGCFPTFHSTENAPAPNVATVAREVAEEDANVGAHDPRTADGGAEQSRASESGQYYDEEAHETEATTSIKTKINFPRPSDVLPREAPHRHQEGDSKRGAGVEQEKAPTELKAKRDHSKGTAPLIDQPRRKQKPPQHDDLFDSTELWTQPTEQHNVAPVHSKLLGQWDELHTIYRNVNKVGVKEVDLDDPDAIALHKCVKKARRVFKRLQEGTTPEHEQSDPLHYFAEIERRVDGLCGQDEKFPTDFDDLSKSRNIYYHVIPRILLRALKDMVEHFVTMDIEEDVGSCSVTMPHLLIISKFIALIMNMGQCAKNYVRPESSYAIIRAVERKLLLPLRGVQAVFTRYLIDVDEAIADRDRRRQAQEEEVLRRNREQEEEIRKVKHDAELKKWQDLHSQRRAVERSILPAKKQRHLRFPDPSQAAAEYDHSGNRFERITAIPRVGPLHADVERAKYEISRWPTKSVEALQQGLERHAGPMVFEHIFREHCGRGGVLNEYNVTQIVVMAATMKVRFALILLKETGMVEDWVDQIPVWASIRPIDVIPDFDTDDTGKCLPWDEEMLERLEAYGARSI